MKHAAFNSIKVTDVDRAAIRASVDRAWCRIIEDRSIIREFRLLQRRERRLSSSKRLQEIMLFSLRCTQRSKRDLRAHPIGKVIRTALRQNDVHFFVQLGRVLSAAPFNEKYRGLEPSRLTEFLLSHWAESFDGLPELFKLTTEGLATVCSHRLNNEKLTSAAVVKLRQRLGLRTIRGRKLNAILIGTRLRFLQGQNPV